MRIINLNKSAFTLVELIIVMSIMAIISVFSFGYFTDFSSKQAMGEDFSNLKQTIINLDLDIRNTKIYDYKITFSTGSLAYTTYINYNNQDYRQILNFNNISLTGTLSVTGSNINTGTEFSYIGYADNKMIFTNILDINASEILNLSKFKKIEINSSISGSTVNNIFLNYYSQANSFLSTNNTSKLILSQINTKENKSGIMLDFITIENINNKKFIKDQSGQILDKAFLFFERAGKEISLEIGQ